MIIKYRDYEYPNIILAENGYLTPLFQNDPETLKNIEKWRTEQNGVVVLQKGIEPYFHEADILSKINENKDGYFDFNKAIIDIGAHVGCYSFRSHFKYAYSFEPNKIIYHFLCINLMIHDKFNISNVYNVMLSDKKEIIKFDGFHTVLDDQQSSFFNDMKPDKNNGRYEDDCITHTLDEYNCTNVGLIKVDVEGMEEKVLRGGIGTIIRNSYPPILFELWDVGYLGMTQEKHNSLKNFLENLGYTIYWHWGDHETHLAIHK